MRLYDQVLESTIDEVKKTGAKYICRSGDVCDKAVARMLVDDTVKEFGSIDILVNNAGTIRRAPAAEHSEEFWNTVINTNLNSVWFLCSTRVGSCSRRGTANHQHGLAAVVSGRHPGAELRCGQRRRGATDQGAGQ